MMAFGWAGAGARKAEGGLIDQHITRNHVYFGVRWSSLQKSFKSVLNLVDSNTAGDAG